MDTSEPRRHDVAIVLGAGGPVGHAYHVGVLRGLADVFSWDPRQASLYVGTSAGAQVAALVRAGLSAQDCYRRVVGQPLSPAGTEVARCFVRPSHAPLRGRYRPASMRYLWATLRRPWTLRAGRLAAALLPLGPTSLEEQIEAFRGRFGTSWPDGLWITAVELHGGRLAVFGRDGAPSAEVGEAVAASGAVPSRCAPVLIEGHAYVDGAIASSTHASLLAGSPHRHAIILSPLSIFRSMRLLFRREVRRLRREGSSLTTFEPRGPVVDAMGKSPLDLDRAPAVARASYAATVRELHERPERFERLAEALGAPRPLREAARHHAEALMRDDRVAE